jgi:hypothetical protein
VVAQTGGCSRGNVARMSVSVDVGVEDEDRGAALPLVRDHPGARFPLVILRRARLREC